MKEKIYEIPVNDAFDNAGECPICAIYHRLETDAVDYTMGPSYMEDDIRMKTDEMGFCNRHLKMVYDKENRLGLALVLSTHMKKINKDMREIIDTTGAKPATKPSLFKKTNPGDLEIVNYINNLEKKCFVCDKINNVFQRYIDTIIYLFNNSKEFVAKYKNCQGFCVEHYKNLILEAHSSLSGSKLDEFLEATNTLFINNMERVYEDVDWFVAKFDYKHQDDPWKNAKDSLPRAMTKLNR